MFKSKDGKSFGSAFVAKRRDTEHAKSENRTMPTQEPGKPTEPKEEPRTAASGMAKKTSSYPGHEVENTADTKASPEGVDAGAVAAEHSPATSVTLHHSKDSHVVVSRHPDGYQHMSQHASHKEAHAAAAKLSGEQHTENSDSAPNSEQTSDADLFGDNFKTPHLA